ncbi:ABC transporter permease subunit [bacterium]|nr:ABC transporter permease subunit [bacterium]
MATVKQGAFHIRAPIDKKQKALLSASVASTILVIWVLLTGGIPGSLEFNAVIPRLILPNPFSVVGAFGVLWKQYETVRFAVLGKEIHFLIPGILMNFAYSFFRITAGFLLAIIISVPLGISMGTYPVIKNAIHPFTGPLRYLPIAALIPLFIVWFGMDEPMKIYFLFVGIFVYLLPLVVEAIECVDHVLVETAYTLKASQWEIIRDVLWPGAKPTIFEAIRVMNGIGWTYIILAEIINAPYGLGRLITIAQKRSKTDWIFAGIIIILVIGFISDRLIVAYNEKKFAWKEQA